MKTATINSNIIVNGTIRKVGETITLEDDRIDNLAKRGLVSIIGEDESNEETANSEDHVETTEQENTEIEETEMDKESRAIELSSFKAEQIKAVAKEVIGNDYIYKNKDEAIKDILDTEYPSEDGPNTSMEF